MATTLEYALMAGASYISTRPDINRFPVPQGWASVIDPPHFKDDATGFEAISFTNGTDIVISYAGTYDNPLNPLTNPDLQADIGLGLGSGSVQLLQAARYYLDVKAANPNATITLTGHSLGGGLASLVGVFFHVNATTFDQAPFANSAQSNSRLNPLNIFTPDVAADLKTDLLTAGYTEIQLAPLSNFLLIRPTDGSIPNSNLITNTRVDGELLSVLPIGLYDTITAAPATVLAHAPTSASSTDLHSQALLTAFLQSDTTAPTGKALDDVTYKLTDLLSMIFDSNLFAHPTDDPDNRNFIDHLVRHEAGNAPMPDGSTVTADAMVTRFTADLWKLAQDGGLTMSYISGNSGGHPTAATQLVGDALTAFAMQFYYEDTANATNASKQLFTDLSTAGTGSNGITFDMHDVSTAAATAIDANKEIDFTQVKGYQYFQAYLNTTSTFTSAEKQLILSMLPQLRDWYVQAGNGGMTAADTMGRGAFMLGGNSGDAMAGSNKTDLLVGNAGDDIFLGNQGNDVLLGGTGNDIYDYATGDGLDTILDTDGNGTLQIDGNALTGGAQYGDNQVFRGVDANGQSHLYTFVTGDRTAGGDLIVDGAMLIKDYQPGQGNGLGLTLAAAAADVIPTTTRDIVGDFGPMDFYDANGNLYYQYDALGNLITDPNKAGARADTLYDSAGNDHIMAGGGNDLINALRGGDDILEGGAGRDHITGGAGNDLLLGGIEGDVLIGGAGDDRLYAEAQIDLVTAIDNGNAAGNTGTGQQGDALSGGAGDDRLIGGDGNDLLAGGAANDFAWRVAA